MNAHSAKLECAAVPLEVAPLDYGIVGAYLALMIALGAWTARRIRVFKDYFLAGGALTTPLLICTLVSTYYELDVTFAVSETGFDSGLVAWFWQERPYYFAIILAALILPARVRRLPCMTLPDVLEHRYGPRARVAGAIACFVYSLPITAIAGLAAMCKVLGWPPAWGLGAAVGVCVLYTTMGGLWADAISDTVQFVLMCGAFAVAIPIAAAWVGGHDVAPHLPAAHMTATGGLSHWMLATWTVSALTVFVEPAFYQRMFAAKDTASIRRALIAGILLWAAYDWGATVLGMFARAAVEQGLLDAKLEGKAALLTVCMHTLPVGLKGLFLGGVLAAAMSSVDSYSLLASGNLVYDIYRPLRGGTLPERTMVRLTRAGVVLVTIVALLASLAFDKITDAWVFMAGALVAVVFVPVTGALFGNPRPAAGFASACAGIAGFGAYLALVYTLGVYDEEGESWVWRAGGLELWREFAVLFALPVSAAGYLIGNLAGKREP
ncbi:MAG: sodium:solute symporter family protein [Planctomycetes bacterium]|nr:sodium:solute symporter family protein [Planctomycetota bacterium]